MKASTKKAIDLYNEFQLIPLTKELNKQCALILVDNLIKESTRYDYLPLKDSRTEFLLEVRNEIEKF